MNARQQQLINELTREFDRLNSSNVSRGSILDIDSYMDEFNDSEIIKNEIKVWNDAIVRELNASFLEEAYQLQKDLKAMNIKSDISEGGSFPSILFMYTPGENIIIRLRYRGESVKLPNLGSINKITGAYVDMGNYTAYSSIKNMCESSVDFKTIIRQAVKYANKNN
jgi:hypothetical protein